MENIDQAREFEGTLQTILSYIEGCIHQGIHESIFPSIAKVFSDLNTILSTSDLSASSKTSLLIDECYALRNESAKLDFLRMKKLAGCFEYIDYLDALHESEFSIKQESSFLLENSCLGDEFDLDDILIDYPKVENIAVNDVVVYVVDGDRVDYFFIDSFKHDVNFIFPSNVFTPRVHKKIEDEFRAYTADAEIFFDFDLSCLPWKIVLFCARLVLCVSRRRTKGRLAQPFDTCD